MTAMYRTVLATALAGCIAGCAIPSSRAPSADGPSPPTKAISADRVRDAVAIGKTTKAGVLAALGETLVIRFDTGFEVWIYRIANDASVNGTLGQRTARMGSGQATGTSAEFVILFAPSGLVVKTRIRPAPPRWHEG